MDTTPFKFQTSLIKGLKLSYFFFFKTHKKYTQNVSNDRNNSNIHIYRLRLVY